MLWLYTDTEVANDEWLEGQVGVRAHRHDDILQNYTVSSYCMTDYASDPCFRLLLFSFIILYCND